MRHCYLEGVRIFGLSSCWYLIRSSNFKSGMKLEGYLLDRAVNLRVTVLVHLR